MEHLKSKPTYWHKSKHLLLQLKKAFAEMQETLSVRPSLPCLFDVPLLGQNMEYELHVDRAQTQPYSK